MKLPSSFPHEPPEGYHYEVEQFRRNVVSIWLRHPDHFNYTNDPVRTIWGFFDTKKGLTILPSIIRKLEKKLISLIPEITLQCKYNIRDSKGSLCDSH